MKVSIPRAAAVLSLAALLAAPLGAKAEKPTLCPRGANGLPDCGDKKPSEPTPEPEAKPEEPKAAETPAPPPQPLSSGPMGRLGVTEEDLESLPKSRHILALRVAGGLDLALNARDENEKNSGKPAGADLDDYRDDQNVQAAFTEALDVFAAPEMPAQPRERLSTMLNKMGRSRDAYSLSDTTLRAEPDNRDALNNRAAASYGLSDYRAAIADATRVMRKDPDNEAALTTRLLSNYSAGNYTEAAEDAKRALALNKNNQIAFQTLQLARNRLSTRQVKLDPLHAAQAEQIKAEYAAMEQQRNQVAESRKLEQLSNVDRASNALNRQAQSKIALNDLGGALADADRAIAANPGNAQAWYLRASAYFQAGEREKAAADATRAIALAPGHALAYDARARALLALGRPQEAVADETQSIALQPSNAYAYATRGRAYEKLGDYASMLADLQKAATLSPQFDPEYRRAAASHALPPPPAAGARAPGRAAPRFWVVIASSVVGGLLIAIGLLHIVSAQWNKKLTTAMRKLEERAAAPAPDLAALKPHFEIKRAIGRGGMGIVYEAVDKALNRRVALKKMRDEIRVDPRERERFLQEARTVAALHHPGIVDIHAIVEEGGELCLVFEYVQGRTVEQLLEEKKRLSLAEARHILRGVCPALDYAHRRGVVHRDLKPSNIMLTDDQEVKVMDFGIARQAKDAMNRFSVTNTVAGTPLYMAPEADQGVVRKESDVYALGACFYEMVTGQRPFPAPATTSAKLAMSYPKPTRVRADLPPAIDALIDGALQADPDKRLPSAGEFLARLEAALSVPAG